ncbi:NADPH-dependent FMN reductase [Rhizobium beringeri]
MRSPIYHNGPSGVLKNALDHLAIKHFAYKPVGLISHGGKQNEPGCRSDAHMGPRLARHAITTQICTQNGDFEAGATTIPVSQIRIFPQGLRNSGRELSVMAKTLAIARSALIV